MQHGVDSQLLLLCCHHHGCHHPDAAACWPACCTVASAHSSIAIDTLQAANEGGDESSCCSQYRCSTRNTIARIAYHRPKLRAACAKSSKRSLLSSILLSCQRSVPACSPEVCSPCVLLSKTARGDVSTSVIYILVDMPKLGSAKQELAAAGTRAGWLCCRCRKEIVPGKRKACKLPDNYK